MDTHGRRLLYLLAALTAAGGAVLLTTPGNLPPRRATSESFQQLTGGLGFGPAADLSGCGFGLDPRLEADCSAGLGPVPGGFCFCGRHTGLLSCPPRPPGDLIPRGHHPLPD